MIPRIRVNEKRQIGELIITVDDVRKISRTFIPACDERGIGTGYDVDFIERVLPLRDVGYLMAFLVNE